MAAGGANLGRVVPLLLLRLPVLLLLAKDWWKYCCCVDECVAVDGFGAINHSRPINLGALSCELAEILMGGSSQIHCAGA